MKKGKVILGVDFGATRIKIGVVHPRGHILYRAALDVKRHESRKTLLDRLVRTLETLLTDYAIPRRSVLGLGMGLPGLVDFERGYVHYLVNVRDFRDVPMASLLRRRLKRPVFVDNDVNLMALGEAAYGAAKGFSHVLCITLGTSVGGGILLDGALYRGPSRTAGEIGHIPLTPGGPPCNCGSWGCLGMYVGNRILLERARRRLRAGARSSVLRLAGGKVNRVTLEMLSRAARKGDRFSQHIWDEAGGWIGMALASAVNLLNLNRIVIGGGVAEAGEVLFRPIRKSLKARAMTFPMEGLKVVKAKLGNDAGIIGASVLVRRALGY